MVNQMTSTIHTVESGGEVLYERWRQDVAVDEEYTRPPWECVSDPVRFAWNERATRAMRNVTKNTHDFSDDSDCVVCGAYGPDTEAGELCPGGDKR